MQTTLSLASPACRRLVTALIAASLLAAAGCAQLPRLGPRPAMKTVQQLGSASAFSAPASPWPGDDWWHAYRDPQLDALIGESLKDSPNLAIAQARLHAAAAVVEGASATRLPEIAGEADFTEGKQSYNDLIPRQALPQGWRDYGQATLDLSWELDFWGKNRAALAAAVSEQKAAAVEVAQTRLILSTSVASAYADLARIYALRDFAAQTLTLRAKTADLFRQRQASGLETVASVREAEARQAAARGELLALDEDIGLQRNAIAALLGAGPDRALTIRRPTAQFAPAQGLPPSLALNLLGRRPDIVAARLRVEAAARRIDEKKAGFYPSVNLVAFAGVESLGIANLTKSGSDFGSAGPAVSLPIFNTRRLQGALRGARAGYDGAVANYNATITNALREVADAATSRKSLTAELDTSAAGVNAAQDAYQAINKRYQGGLATYLDVLVAQDALISAERSQAELKTRALSLDIDLVGALGGGFSSQGQQVLAATSP
jgi:NodT family efflux transporter outer membrane factor (OMF) lipoprotein